MQLLIIGGDERNRYLAALARAHGHTAQLVGHDETPLLQALPSSCVVLPFPVAETEGFAPAPLSGERLPMETVCALCKPQAAVYATRPGPILAKYIIRQGLTRIDFMENETFTLRNAAVSAEGAIYALMGRSRGCIDRSACLIVGYGRIGRALARRLEGLGARVIVAARSASARANAEMDGCQTIPLERMGEVRCRFLLNTVPARVIGADVLAELGSRKTPAQWAVGFALETDDPRIRAIRKMEAKNCDLMILNAPSAIDSLENEVEIFDARGETLAVLRGGKSELAKEIFGIIERDLIH